MKRIYLYLSMTLSLFLTACSVVPLTGRQQLNLVPNDQILASSSAQYHQFIAQAPLSKDAKANDRVRRVGSRIAAATERYLNEQGLSSRVKELKWEFNLVNSDQLNAFCMPGGKIVVYTGLLNRVSSDDELAAVIGHEVAHAVAYHGNERISNEMIRQLGGQVLGAAVARQGALLQQVVGQAYGVGTQVFVSLPYSRKQEYEADKIGLIFMAMAGYNPEGAIKLWQMMSANKKGAIQSDFLSTHPSDQKRMDALRTYMPEAMKYYHGKGGSSNKITLKDTRNSGAKLKGDEAPKTSEKWHF